MSLSIIMEPHSKEVKLVIKECKKMFKMNQLPNSTELVRTVLHHEERITILEEKMKVLTMNFNELEEEYKNLKQYNIIVTQPLP